MARCLISLAAFMITMPSLTSGEVAPDLLSQFSKRNDVSITVFTGKHQLDDIYIAKEVDDILFIPRIYGMLQLPIDSIKRADLTCVDEGCVLLKNGDILKGNVSRVDGEDTILRSQRLKNDIRVKTDMILSAGKSRRPPFQDTSIGEQHKYSRLGKIRSVAVCVKRQADLAQLLDLTSLTSVSFKSSNMEDVLPLAKLPKLFNLEFEDSRVKNWGSLRVITSLKYLSFGNRFVGKEDDLKALQGIPNISLFNIEIKDLGIFANIKGIKNLSFKQCKIQNTEGLKKLTQITELRLESCGISTLAGIQMCSNLRTLSLSDNPRLSDLTQLKALKKLKEVNVSGTSISDISILGDKNIEFLNISGTKVPDLLALNHKTLKFLIMQSTPVRDLSPLKDAVILKGLDIKQSPIADYSVLLQIKSLRRLALDTSKVNSDILSDLRTQLPKLDTSRSARTLRDVPPK